MIARNLVRVTLDRQGASKSVVTQIKEGITHLVSGSLPILKIALSQSEKTSTKA